MFLTALSINLIGDSETRSNAVRERMTPGCVNALT